jgi:hypothetical protein
MRVLSPKRGCVVPDPAEAESALGGAGLKSPTNEVRRNACGGRTIYPEAMRMAETGWARQAWDGGETVMRREGEVSDEEHAAAREWLWHLDAGRIGPQAGKEEAPSETDDRAIPHLNE